MKTKYTQFRRNYWSLGKVSKWILPEWDDSPKTAEDWQEHNRSVSEKAPVRYWIAQEGIDHLQDIVMFPMDFLVYWRDYFKNRMEQSHCLCSDLAKGEYHDKVELLLHANFQALVDFVEIECASAYSVFHIHKDMKERRNPRHGMMYLKMEINEGGEERAKAAEEILNLYDWWTNQRPARQEPLEVKTPEAMDSKYGLFNLNFVLPYEEIARLENEYQEEDQQMLHRLMDVRMYLWK